MVYLCNINIVEHVDTRHNNYGQHCSSKYETSNAKLCSLRYHFLGLTLLILVILCFTLFFGKNFAFRSWYA